MLWGLVTQMRNNYLSLVNKFLLLGGLVILLSSCVQNTPQASSRSANTQLLDLQKQQQRQASMIESLQQQLNKLQKQLEGSKTIPVQNTPITTSNDVAINYNHEQSEVTEIAASAASYLAAFSHLAAGRAAAAEVGFEAFLTNFQDHEYAPNARYWLAEAQLAQGKTELAQANLQQLATNPKAKHKVPAALLQLAHIYRQQGRSIEADNVLEQLRNHYPESPEAQQLYRSADTAD